MLMTNLHHDGWEWFLLDHGVCIRCCRTLWCHQSGLRHTRSYIDFALLMFPNHFNVTNPMIIWYFVVVMRYDSLFNATEAQDSIEDILSADTHLLFYSPDLYKNHHLYLTGPDTDSLILYVMCPCCFQPIRRQPFVLVLVLRVTCHSDGFCRRK